MEDKFITIQQYKHLQDIGVKFNSTAFCWVKEESSQKVQVLPNSSDLQYMCYVHIFPALMLDDVVKMLPDKLFRYSLRINVRRKEIEYADGADVLIDFSYKDNILEAAYDALVWVTNQQTKS